MISERKTNFEKGRIVSNCIRCNGSGCHICFGYCNFIDYMVFADIPVDYWHRDMKKFYGDENFKNVIIKYMVNMTENYANGSSMCLVGHTGTGKTMAACAILKKAISEGFKALYITMIEATTKMMSKDSYKFRQDIKEYDFLVIDEVDPRFFPTDASSDLHGSHFEYILRTRSQNKLPTIICTNTNDVDQIFCGEFQKTFNSLRSQFVKTIIAGGTDVRKGKEQL